MPNKTKIRQIDQEDGDHSIWRNPYESQERNPEVIHNSPCPPLCLAERHVLPDDVVWPRSQHDAGALGMFLLRGKCDSMSLLDLLIARKSIRQGVSHIDRCADLF